jgi:hypothetical protein
MRAARLRKRIDQALVNIEARLNDHDDSKFARGLASEGYVGGYRDALYAVSALIRDYAPQDSRGFWRSAPQPEPPAAGEKV